MFQRLFRRKTPRIVALGGGTGLATLLRGLKGHTEAITAVVTVADDGGSSGRLRKGFDLPPPGDIRNCLVALSDAGPLMDALLQYRFEEAELRGHSVGNLLLTALTRITGDFRAAVGELNQILNVRGQVLPATDEKVALIATHPDGSKSTGEVQIARAGKPITHLELKPRPRALHADIAEAISQADLIALGPGSLYTSILPNLLVPGMVEALLQADARVVYVCNVMTQPGETTHFSAADHLAAVLRHTHPRLVDAMIVNSAPIPPLACERYSAQGQQPVAFDRATATNSPEALAGVEVVTGDFVNVTETVRHDATRLGECVLALARRPRAPRRVSEPHGARPAVSESARRDTTSVSPSVAVRPHSA